MPLLESIGAAFEQCVCTGRRTRRPMGPTSTEPQPVAVEALQVAPAEPTLTVLHFNDVYNVEGGQQEPVGGAARFCTALKSLAHLHPLILFSGDIFAPSFSTIHAILT